jgi:hypothetical protein
MERRTDPERSRYSMVCVFCVHMHRDRGTQGSTCAAFPGGIPESIWEGRDKHQQPHPGDHGIRFEARPDAKPEMLRRYGL